MNAIKKIIAALCCLLLLAGCQSKSTLTRDGQPWEDSWTRVGFSLGVADPGAELTQGQVQDALSTQGRYYAAWNFGEKSSFQTSDGAEADIYDAQLYLSIQDGGNDEGAKSWVDQWTAATQDRYPDTRQDTVTQGGQTFARFTYQVDDPANPYGRGITALSLYDGYAISVELMCQAEFDGDPEAVLNHFLSCLRYGEPKKSN